MLINQPANKTLLATSIALLLAIGSGQAFAEADIKTPRVYVDPATGAVTEILKLPSEMTADEMASYSVEELENLKAIEKKLKEQAQETN